jgi:hypothetical protein
MKYLTSVMVSLLLVSCTTIKNVSQLPEFDAELGERILVKEAFICEDNDKAMFEHSLPNNMMYENNGFKLCPRGKHVASINKGVKVTISEASYRSHFGVVSYTDHWYLIGSTDIENKQINFYIYLGLTTDGKPPNDYINKLLWH